MAQTEASKAFSAEVAATAAQKMRQSKTSRGSGYRGLLALVIILGVLIVLAVIGLIVGAVLRFQRSANPVQPFSASLSAPGERLDSIQMDGNRLLLHLSGPNGDEIVIMDGSGHLVGRIAIDNKP
jgi:hypothetical protein